MQPFALTTEAAALGVRVDSTPSEDLALDGPYRLNTLWNMDKHPRLPNFTWLVGLVISTEEIPWTSLAPRHSVWMDGTVVGQHRLARPEDIHPLPLSWEISLTLAEDPAPYSDDVVRQLECRHMSLGGWVVPRPASPLV